MTVRVIPRAASDAVAGTRDGAVLVRLTAPPVDGTANAALIEMLARVCGVTRRDVAIVSGPRSRLKTVRVTGATQALLAARLKLPSTPTT